jgi:ornithine--oxo-acid transaminase
VREILKRRTGEEMALNDRYLNPQLGRILRTLGFDRTWVRGEGAHLIDSRGDRYLDLYGGYGVFALGRNHPDVIAAVGEVMEAQTGNLPQLGVTLLSGVLAEQLLARAPGSVAAMVPANTGTEAVEATIKIARAATGRPRILYADHAFHGLTLGSLSLNGNDEFRDGFGPLLPGCDPVPFGDANALKKELERGDVAAFVVEPVQGKGVNIPAPDYLRTAQELCRAAGALLCCDEVQTGLGRTGRFLALEHWGLDPDIVCLSKALSGGLVPIGAVLVSRAAFDRVFDGMERAVRHGSTFGGNDLAAAAALATLGVLDREGLVERSARMGELLLELTRPLVDRYDVVSDVRGLGLMWAIEFDPLAGAGAGAPHHTGPGNGNGSSAGGNGTAGDGSGNGNGAPPGARRRGGALWGRVERAQPGLFSQMITVPLFTEHHILCQVAGHRMNVIKALPALLIEEDEVRRFAAALEQVVAQAARAPAALALSRFGLGVARRRALGRR